MNFTEGRSLRAAPAQERSYQNYDGFGAHERKTLPVQNHKKLSLKSRNSRGEKEGYVPKDKWSSQQW